MRTLFKKNGNDIGECMTVAELKQVLSKLPDDMLITGTWEGINEPLRSAEVVSSKFYVEPFLQLDVDSF